MQASPQADIARLEKSPRDLERWQRAHQQLLAGRAAGVLPVYHDLTQRFPNILNLWMELATAAAAELDFPLACQSLERAKTLAGANSAALILVAQQYHRLRQSDHARACFQAAVEADPSSTHARLSWAAWLERERRLAGARSQVEACLARNPKEPSALYYDAFLLHRSGQPAEAEKALRNLAQTYLGDPNVKISCFHLLGVVLDELGQCAEAMEWLLKAKAVVRQTNNVAALEQTYDKADRQRRGLLAQLTSQMIRNWTTEPQTQPMERKLALLGGHPRSGTTLIEQVLGAHPAVRAFDESEAFVGEVGDKLAPLPPGAPLNAKALDALPASKRNELRRRYLRSLFRETQGEPPAHVLLDKNPTPTASLHLWLRVFPESKVIIALRDPRDVIISCFSQNLALTPLNVNFLSLERSVKHYADLMDTWLRLRELRGFDWIETRYEDVVAGLEAEARRVTEFLGLSWHPGQSAWREAAERKLLYSPTYSDVAKPVHDRAKGRWRNYASALEPLLPRLDVYLKALGYG